MQTQTVRITAADHAALTELARSSGKSMSAVLSEAVQDMQRNQLLRQTNEAYQRLKEDRTAWEEESQERRMWENTIADGTE
jgi:predicted transcriptional regulator